MEEFTDEKIGAILKQLRLNAGLTQEQAGKSIGRNYQMIGHWERGYSKIDANEFLKLCKVYEADIAVEFGLSDGVASLTKNECAIIDTYRANKIVRDGIDATIKLERGDDPDEEDLNGIKRRRKAAAKKGNV